MKILNLTAVVLSSSVTYAAWGNRRGETLKALHLPPKICIYPLSFLNFFYIQVDLHFTCKATVPGYSLAAQFSTNYPDKE